ncbi:hypothetical protein DGWBC_1117 [Dehalogenimonas sp. WBC-2]|nr:hypothetical protein DGWBC_1117 [Dehalogenimonas sp. WBC-2]
MRTPEGRVTLDATGRVAGRGAYICREIACLNTAVKGNQIEHVLKVKMCSEDREALKAAISDIIKEQSSV